MHVTNTYLLAAETTADQWRADLALARPARAAAPRATAVIAMSSSTDQSSGEADSASGRPSHSANDSMMMHIPNGTQARSIRCTEV